MKRGVATFTLDSGKAPKWLFSRMVKLGREMTQAIVEEYGPDEYIKRLSDPVWFQSLGCVLAFDWNASGLTTTLTAALKQAIRGQEEDLGIFICGGKGKTSRKTPDEITSWGEKLNYSQESVNSLVYNSKMSAKVDSSLIQDDYQIYHHAFMFSRNGAWAVIQQGMNKDTKTARRYHWHSQNLKNLIEEPHTAIATQLTNKDALDLTSSKSSKNRDISTDLVKGGFKTLMNDIKIMRKHSSELSETLAFKYKNDEFTLMKLANREFKHHRVESEDFWKSKYLDKIFKILCDAGPGDYEELLATKGVGPKTIRALSLVSEVIYDAPASYEDPARYSFAHGGKDGSPYFVNKERYDNTIKTMQNLVKKTKLERSEKNKVLKRTQKLL